MKIIKLFFVDLSLFLIFFGLAGSFLYREVYSEETLYPKSGGVLISEVKPSGGPGKTTDEFVELYNPTSDPQIIGGWLLAKQTKSASSTDWTTLFTFPVGQILPSHAHILVAHSDYSGETVPDFRYSGQSLAEDNTVVLLSSDGAVVDLLGYGLAKNVEIQAAESPTTQLLSLERKPGGPTGNGLDTNNNFNDFFRTIPNPQNLLAVAVVEVTLPEVVTSTVSIVTTTEVLAAAIVPTSSLEITLASSSPHYLLSSVLITEVYPTPASGEAEFVELFNPTPQAISLAGWFLFDGGGGKTSLEGVIGSTEYLVVEKPKGSLNNSGDLVKIVAPDETIIDQVVYGDWDDGQIGNNAHQPGVGESLIRVNEWQDANDDYQEFEVSIKPSKGQKNIRQQRTIAVEKIATTTTSEEKVIEKTRPLSPRAIYTQILTVNEIGYFDASLSTGGVGVKQYLWEMDDGLIERGELVSHSYSLPGNYSMVLTMFDETGEEKHKTYQVKVKDRLDAGANNKLQVTSAVKKETKEPVATYVPIGSVAGLKNNTPVRVRGILAGIFWEKTNPEYYLVGESASGGSAVGLWIKTKSTSLQASLGDVIELTGKYQIVSSGNVFMFGASDQLTLVQNNEIYTPVSTTVKSALQLAGGFVTVRGEISDKKSSHFFLDDGTGEIKVLDSANSYKKGDQVLVSGYLVKIKNNLELKVASPDDIKWLNQEQKVVLPDTNTVHTEYPVRKILIGLGVFIFLGGCLIYKKFFTK